MGVVYQATDQRTRERVAIKVVANLEATHVSRFLREAEVLAKFSHPSIVRYVARGTTAPGAPFLAMEWLDGEDLATRLSRAPFSVEDSLSALKGACGGIAIAHAAGVVHRDLKPSNLFLVDGQPSSLKVLDFGIARQLGGPHTLSQAGAFLGTVGYMSPEQALAAHAVDARADVFALGCVLFECLTGRAAFVGPNSVAVLAKVLREDPPRVSELRPSLGRAFDDLVTRLLAKEPSARPNDATAVLQALEQLGSKGAPSVSGSHSEGLSESEQKFVTVLLGKPVSGVVRAASETMDVSGVLDADQLRELESRLGSEPIAMRGGAWLVVLADRGVATDQAARAATGALLLQRVQPGVRLAVATGRAQTTGRTPVGPVIDRAAQLLDACEVSSVAIDELTASLLDPRFVVRRTVEGIALTGERSDGASSRLLMGKPTPFVGRDKELGLLQLTLRQCIDESVARAVLVTGPPGQGKSRLRQEFVEHTRSLGEVRILSARADPVGAGSALMLVRQLVREAAGLRDDDPGVDQLAALREHVLRVCGTRDFARITDFLGELVGLPIGAEPCPQLRAARDDSQTMSAWFRRSFGEWLADECAAEPLLIVLEDLHWGDLPSVQYIGEALPTIGNPLLVLALARPEVYEAFPDIWSGAEKFDIALGRLSPRAAERIMRAVLGNELDERTVASVVDRADGNAFYLEELIRVVAQGETEKLPETVLAVVDSRLQRLAPEARRVVRAASVFGETFWRGGVAALAGIMDASDLDAQLSVLVQNEVIAPARESRFSSQDEYTFRHSLLREAAYGMLGEPDRANGHRLAGKWLEHAGENDALMLADHFALGGERERAVFWLTRATEMALDGGNVQATITLGERALAFGAAGVARGILLRMQAAACFERGDPVQACALGREALPLLSAGSGDWFLCVAKLMSASAFAGDQGNVAFALHAILTVPVELQPSGPYGWAVMSASAGLLGIGKPELARSILERAESIERRTVSRDCLFVVRLRLSRAMLNLLTGEIGSAFTKLAEAQVAASQCAHASDLSSAHLMRIRAYAEAGSLERAEASLKDLLSVGGSNGLRYFSDRGNAHIASAKLDAHRAEEAIQSLRPLTERLDHGLAVSARALLAHAYVASGDLAGATQEANAVLAEPGFSAAQPKAFAALASVAMAQSAPADALVLAEQGLAAWSRAGWLRDRSILRLARAEALHGSGRFDDARVAIREARDEVLATAATLDDPHLRTSYLTKIDANASILRLAGEWLD
jgi:hypothetical protein